MKLEDRQRLGDGTIKAAIAIDEPATVRTNLPTDYRLIAAIFGEVDDVPLPAWSKLALFYHRC